MALPTADDAFTPPALPQSVQPRRRRFRRLPALAVAAVLGLALTACGSSGPGASSGNEAFLQDGSQLMEQAAVDVSNPTGHAVRMTMHVDHGTGCGTTISTLPLYADGDCTGVPIKIGDNLYTNIPQEEWGRATLTAVGGTDASACSITGGGAGLVCTVPARQSLRVRVLFPVTDRDTPSTDVAVDSAVGL